MTWAAFGILGKEIRDKEDLFKDWSNTQLIAIKQTQAKHELLMDLIDNYGFDTSTDTDLESLLDEQTDLLREILAIKQLSLYYFDNDNGDGSVNRHKSRRYALRYEQEFKRLRHREDSSENFGSGFIAR